MCPVCESFPTEGKKGSFLFSCIKKRNWALQLSLNIVYERVNYTGVNNMDNKRLALHNFVCFFINLCVCIYAAKAALQ